MGNGVSQGFLFLSGTSVSITSKYLLLFLHEAKWMAYTFLAQFYNTKKSVALVAGARFVCHQFGI